MRFFVTSYFATLFWVINGHYIRINFINLKGIRLRHDNNTVKLTRKSAFICCKECTLSGRCVSASFNRYDGKCELNIGSIFTEGNDLFAFTPYWDTFEMMPCGLGWQTGRNCRHLISLACTYIEAQEYCSSFYDNIVALNTKIELNGLYVYLDNTNRTDLVSERRFWVGFNNSAMPWNATVVDVDGDGRCLVINPEERNQKDFESRNCDSRFWFVCERRIVWMTLKDTCDMYHMHWIYSW